MTIPVWQVITWKPVRATLEEWQIAVKGMRLLGASSAPQTRQAGPRQGQVLWGCECRGEPVGLAWDWAEVRQDIVALSDPMSVLSNVTLLDEQGECLDDGLRIVELNTAVHGLDWQKQVRARPVTSRLAA